MLQIDNRTPFNAALAVFADRQGVETAYLAVKAAFDIDPAQGLRPTARPLPLLPGDVYWGDPATSSLRAAGELTLCKPATDIVVLGHAVAPREGQVAMPVALRVGPVHSTLLVTGRRHWQRRVLTWEASEPEPFDRVPLRWEHAYGGFERRPEGEVVREFEPHNPVGCGLVGSRESGFEDRPLPQVEHPGERLEQPRQRVAPAGWAPIPPSWSPRREYGGTYDAAWQKRRAPFLPHDFDERFLQTAPPALVAPGFLAGGEPVQLAGCRPRGEVLAFELPQCTITTVFRFRGGEHELTPRLDSVILEPDQPRLQMIWRAGFAVDKHLLKLSQVRVDCAEYPRDEYLGRQLRRAA